jgi:hypothetical protein
MARATKTKDGFTVTTIEQAGAYEGQAIGRVLLLRGDNCDYDHWTLGSVESADEAANQAPNLTRKEFTEYLDGLRNYREIMNVVVMKTGSFSTPNILEPPAVIRCRSDAYLGLEQISRKWTMPIKNWKAALQQFAILYEDRLPLEAPGVTKA